jgi:hypothetical protein
MEISAASVDLEIIPHPSASDVPSPTSSHPVRQRREWRSGCQAWMILFLGFPLRFGHVGRCFLNSAAVNGFFRHPHGQGVITAGRPRSNLLTIPSLQQIVI